MRLIDFLKEWGCVLAISHPDQWGTVWEIACAAELPQDELPAWQQRLRQQPQHPCAEKPVRFSNQSQIVFFLKPHLKVLSFSYIWANFSKANDRQNFLFSEVILLF